MRRTVIVVISCVLVVLSAWPSSAAPPEGGRIRYVVGFHATPRAMRDGDDFHGSSVRRVDRVLHFAVVEASSRSFEARAKNDRNVRYVEEDTPRKLIELTPNDPSYVQQYGPQHVRAPQAWDTSLGTTAKNVCIVDTGVRYTHQDLTGPRWLGGFDFVNNDNDPRDDNGHGTHVAGSAAATTNNGLGIAGIAQSGIKATKVLDQAGFGSNANVASGIRWCADNGGQVISMSLGGGGGQAMADAVAYAWGAGALLVAAAGNSGPCTNCVSYPAKFSDVIAVTCTNAAKAECSFSSDGPESELAAPGEGILSTYANSDTSYASLSGTSMSTPHVSGVAALVWSQVPGLSNGQLRQVLTNHAQDLGPAGWDQQFGFGLVDAEAALDAALTPRAPESQVFLENFDDGVANGWTLSGLWHVSGACATPPSAPKYLGYNRDTTCTYNTGARTTGTATFDVDLSPADAATLAFDHRFTKETFGSGAYDIMRVQVSTNGGASWTTLRQWDSRSANKTTFGAESLYLDPYVGGVVRIRLFFDSVDNTANAFLGWLVDNVKVTTHVPAPPNTPPTADAGPDQTVTDTDGSGAENVTLDGTGSFDPDGTIVSYEWREGATLLATGATPTLSFAVGAHTVTLTVTDDDGAPDTDDVVITVNAQAPPNTPPTADAGPDQTVTDTDGSGAENVTLDGTGSFDPDGTIVSYEWREGATLLATGATPTLSFAVGAHTVTLTVTDDDGAPDTDDVVITVQPAAARLSENFDDGAANGWTLTGLWHVSGACAAAASAPNYLGYNKDATCTYATGARTSGTATVDVGLAGAASATLSFDHRFTKEVFSSGIYDVMRVQVSTNGGSTWTSLRQWDSRNANQLSWVNQTFSLNAYVGGTIKLRFLFDSVDGTSNNFLGWLIDNVAVTTS